MNSGVSKVIIEQDIKKMFCFHLYFKTWICNWKKGSDIEKIKKNYQKLQ